MTAKTASKTETGRTLFSGSMKLSDLLDINYRLLPLLPLLWHSLQLLLLHPHRQAAVLTSTLCLDKE